MINHVHSLLRSARSFTDKALKAGSASEALSLVVDATTDLQRAMGNIQDLQEDGWAPVDDSRQCEVELLPPVSTTARKWDNLPGVGLMLESGFYYLRVAGRVLDPSQFRIWDNTACKIIGGPFVAVDGNAEMQCCCFFLKDSHHVVIQWRAISERAAHCHVMKFTATKIEDPL